MDYAVKDFRILILFLRKELNPFKSYGFHWNLRGTVIRIRSRGQTITVRPRKEHTQEKKRDVRPGLNLYILSCFLTSHIKQVGLKQEFELHCS